jgi:uncharacterized protein YfaS (alpha-2-macroglobulin family)
MQIVKSPKGRIAVLLFFSAIAIILTSVSTYAQQGRGTLSGIVSAPDGKPQAKARVFLQSSNGRAPHTALTDADGHYTFKNLRPGMYELKAQANGNWSELQRNINVHANQEATMDLKLVPPAPPKPKTP